MDVALSLATGLGLRVYLIRLASPTSFIAPALLGLWEGVLVHQLSFHPPPSVSSSPLDHYLAFGLRLVVDLLIAGNPSKVIMVALWAVVGTILSESAFPGLSSSFVKGIHRSSTRRDKEKRRRHSRPAPSHVPSHIRVYQPPVVSPTAPLPIPPPQTSTPAQPATQLDTRGQIVTSPTFPPPSPPSFFLHAETEPSPYPDSPASPKPTTIITQIPVRPRSALSFYEGEKVREKVAPSGSEPPGVSTRSPHLPTPPDSTIRERTMDSRVDRLSTIDEITSRSEHVTEDIEQGEVEGEENYIFVSHGGGDPLPVPNATSHYVGADDDGAPIASLAPSVAPSAIPLPIPPVAYRSDTPSNPDGDELRTPGQPVYDFGAESDLDELKTPPTLQAHSLKAATATSTPRIVNGSVKPEDALSPLILASQSIAPENGESIPIPGTSLSSYAILQTPVEPTPLGPLLDSAIRLSAKSEIELPLSPSNESDAESVLSTRIPIKLIEHADDFRQQANAEKNELRRLEAELRLAEKEKRGRDALFLRGDICNAKEKIKRLDEKAARRHFAGE